MAKIFISYDRASKHVIQQLVQDLTDDDADFWFDQHLTGGQHWWNDILSKIRECEIFVAALTPEFLESKACQRETNYAKDLQRRLLPVRLSDSVSPDALPSYLSELVWEDYSVQSVKAFRSLQRTLKHLPNAPPLPDPLPDPPPVPISYWGNLRRQIDSDSLTLQDQKLLVFELGRQFRSGDSLKEIIDILQRLKKRDDLFSVISREVDYLQQEIDRGRSGEVSVESPTLSNRARPRTAVGKPSKSKYNSLQYENKVKSSPASQPIVDQPITPIMAIGLNYAVNGERDEREPPSVKGALRALKPSLLPSKIVEITRNKAALTFDKYEDAEDLIQNIFKYCIDTNERATEENELYFEIVLMAQPVDRTGLEFVKVISLLGQIFPRRKGPSSSYSVQVYITKEVYAKLPPRYQDLYQSPIEVGATALHQRFSGDAQRCYVISPIGDPNSAIRKRADLVFERYIKPACESAPFRPVRGERGNFIMSDLMDALQFDPMVMDALQSDPMVIVYLGPPKLGYEPNVMFELGGRDATGAPYIVIKDATSEGNPYDLPFDVKASRVVDIPEQEEDNHDLVAVRIRTIRERILASIQETEWDHVHPRATINMKIGDPEGASKFIWASKDMETLFEMKGIVGRDVITVYNGLLEKMPPCQRGPFINDQNTLIGRLVVSSFEGGIRNIHATIPIVFRTHQKYKGNAFLPIIAGYSFTAITNNLRLKMIYIDVTAVTTLNKEKGHYTCALTSNAKIDLPEGS